MREWKRRGKGEVKGGIRGENLEEGEDRWKGEKGES